MMPMVAFFCLNSLHTARPSRLPGIMMSSTATSKSPPACSYTRKASSPLAASTQSYPARFKLMTTNSRIFCSSSATNIFFMFVSPFCPPFSVYIYSNTSNPLCSVFSSLSAMESSKMRSTYTRPAELLNRISSSSCSFSAQSSSVYTRMENLSSRPR